MFKPKGVMILTLLIMLMVLSCSGPESEQPLLTADLPLHLEEHLDDAMIEGSKIPEDVSGAVEWRFDEPQPDWKQVNPLDPAIKPVKVIRTEDALRVIMSKKPFVGGIYIDLPAWQRKHWAYILVSARTSDNIRNFFIGFNLDEDPETRPGWEYPFRNVSKEVPVITDGSVQTYRIRADFSRGKWEEQWQQLCLGFVAKEPASIDILSVSIIRREASYADAPVGVSREIRNSNNRRTLYTHVPGRLEYKVRMPKAGRLDVGLGVVRQDVPVTFRITANPSFAGLYQVRRKYA